MTRNTPNTNLPSIEVLGSVLSFVPAKYRTKVIKSSKALPGADLLFQFYDLSKDKVCLAFEDKDFELLIRNTNLDRQGLFKCVVERGLTKYVKILFADKQVDPSAKDNEAIRWAARDGYLEIVKVLLADKRVDPSAKTNSAIRWAAENGHLEVVKILIQDPRVDPSTKNNYAIRWAAKNCRLEVVKVLLTDKRVDPSADTNWAIRWAARSGHDKVVKILILGSTSRS